MLSSSAPQPGPAATCSPPTGPPRAWAWSCWRPADGRAVVQMRVAQTMINGHGIAHGGFVFTLADTAFACACNTYGPVTVAAGADISFLCPVREGDVLVATATERVVTGRSGIYDVTVSRGEEVVAEFRGRSRTIG